MNIIKINPFGVSVLKWSELFKLFSSKPVAPTPESDVPQFVQIWDKRHTDLRDHIVSLLDYHLVNNHMPFRDALFNSVPIALHYFDQPVRMNVMLPVVNANSYVTRIDRALSAGIDVFFSRLDIQDDKIIEIPFIRISQYVAAFRADYTDAEFPTIQTAMQSFDLWQSAEALDMQSPHDFSEAIEAILVSFDEQGYSIYRAAPTPNAHFIIQLVKDELYVEFAITFNDLKVSASKTMAQARKLFC